LDAGWKGLVEIPDAMALCQAKSRFVGRSQCNRAGPPHSAVSDPPCEQKEPVRRRVALKVIKLGMDTKQVVARFEAERQALR
jgi:hypothetical protein